MTILNYGDWLTKSVPCSCGSSGDCDCHEKRMAKFVEYTKDFFAMSDGLHTHTVLDTTTRIREESAVTFHSAHEFIEYIFEKSPVEPHKFFKELWVMHYNFDTNGRLWVSKSTPKDVMHVFVLTKIERASQLP